MVSPKSSPRRGSWRSGRRGPPGAVIGVVVAAVILGFLGLAWLLLFRTTSVTSDKQATKLFIAIGSKPSNWELRDGARRSWLKWRRPGQVEYRFFSDAPPRSGKMPQEFRALVAEAKKNEDVVLMPIESGYGTIESNNFLARAMYQLQYALDNYIFDYYLRVDDDSFLCLHRLQFELASYPARQFFMGRYWCKSGRHRADENYMLFTRDLVEFLGSGSAILPMDPNVTFAWNFGLMAYFLNITTFDDQTRIDAQQGYLTDYMHAESVSKKDLKSYRTFCDRYLYAHHVRSAEVMTKVYDTSIARMIYDAPNMTNARSGCKAADQSYIPNRHSKTLPNIIVSANSDNGR